MLHNGRRKLLVSVLRKPGALVKTDDFFFFFLQLILKYFVLKELVLAVV